MEIEGLLGRKIGMTTLFEEKGTAVAVTLLEVGPCVVTQIRTAARDGYEAVQLGFLPVKRLNKPLTGHMRRSGEKLRHLGEFAVDDLAEFEVGQTLDASVFHVGDVVSIRGRTKGRGFAGGVRRYNFRGGPKTHGQSDRFRAPGAIGAGSDPARVWKGTKMAGHMGHRNVTQRGLEVKVVDPERHLVGVAGAVPGPRNGVVLVQVQERKGTTEAAA